MSDKTVDEVMDFVERIISGRKYPSKELRAKLRTALESLAAAPVALEGERQPPIHHCPACAHTWSAWPDTSTEPRVAAAPSTPVPGAVVLPTAKLLELASVNGLIRLSDMMKAQTQEALHGFVKDVLALAAPAAPTGDGAKPLRWLTEEERDAVVDALPGGPSGFLKQWGTKQLAEALNEKLWTTELADAARWRAFQDMDLSDCLRMIANGTDHYNTTMDRLRPDADGDGAAKGGV